MAEADEQKRRTSPPERVWKPTQELRIALAMRGGVSLAVWIGGAVAEFDVMRRGVLQAVAERDRADQPVVGATGGPPYYDALSKDQQQRADAYGAFLGGQYTGISIDVLAGASAGGLNAVLYGAAQSLGAGVQWMKLTWHEAGDLWALMRPGWRPGQPYRIPSLLQGDGPDGFSGKVQEELSRNLQAWRPELVAPHLSIDLAATLVTAPPVRRGGKESARAPEAHFHFRKYPRGAGAVDDLPGSPGDDQALAKLAYAARTTSSFPGAFEPARFHSVPQALLDAWEDAQDPPPSGSSEPPILNLHRVFSETTMLASDNEELTGDGAQEPALLSVFDGGVFDNIPIVRALDAISDMPADSRVDRRLFYFDPDPPDLEQPPGVGETPGRGDLSTFFVSTATRALGMKQRQETSEDDIAVLRRAMEDGDLAARQREFVFDRSAAGLGEPTDLAGPTVVEAYVRWRAHQDARRLTELALNPGLVTLRALIDPAFTDDVLNQTDALTVRFKLRNELERAHLGRLDDVAYDARSLHLLCGHLITASRVVEETATALSNSVSNDTSKDASTAKQRLHLLRAAAGKFAAWADRSVLSAINDDGFDADEMVLRFQEAAFGAAPDGSARNPVNWAEKTLDEPEFWAALHGQPSTSYAVHKDALWELAAELAVPLDSAITWAGLGSPSVENVARLNAFLCDSLESPNLLTLRRFQAITGSQPSVAATQRDYSKLEDGARRANVVTLLGLSSRQFTEARITWQLERGLFTARTKLAGNQLGNFAGFLDADWRDHDFEWGRRDAAAAIAAMFGRRDAPGLGALWWGDPPPQGSLLDGEGVVEPPDLNQSRLGLGDLPAGRRFALVSRGLQLLHRAVWPLTMSASASGSQRVGPSIVGLKVTQLAIAALLLLLRVPLAVAPLFISIRRLLPVLLLGLLAARLTVPDLHLTQLARSPVSEPSWVALAALAGAVVLVVSRCLRFVPRWQRLGASSRSEQRDPGYDTQLPVWARNGRLLSIVALTGGTVIVVLVLAQVLVSIFGLSGPTFLVTGWQDSTAFERLVLIAAALACAVALPAILRTPVDRLGPWHVVKVLALEVGVAALPLAVLASPDDPSTVLGWWSDGWGALTLHALLAAMVVAAVLVLWVQIHWVAVGTVVTGMAVVVGELIVRGMQSLDTSRALTLLAAVGVLVVLIGLLQLIGAATTRPAAQTALGMVGMAFGACLVAVVGQLLFQPFGRIGVPLGLWQGMFCAALVTVFAQPIPPPGRPEQASH